LGDKKIFQIRRRELVGANITYNREEAGRVPRDRRFESGFLQGSVETEPISRGTGISNPSPSTGESANPRSLLRRMVNPAGRSKSGKKPQDDAPRANFIPPAREEPSESRPDSASGSTTALLQTAPEPGE
jgi:hypothetical protein